MSRLLVTRLFTSAMRPAITMNASRSSSMILRNARIQLEKSPMRFLASWGFKDPVDRKEIEFRVIRCIATHDKVDQSQVSIASHLVNDLGLDSLDQVEIIVGIEDEFKVEIEDIISEKLLSVKDIVEYLVHYFETTDPKAKNPGPKFHDNMKFG